MSPTLAVYETEPLESKLDIYLETSTAGEISLLNEKILSTDTVTPKGFCNGLGTSLMPILTEDTATNTNFIGSNIYVQNAAGGILSLGDILSVNAFSCRDGTGTLRHTDFKFGTISTNYFQLLTNAYFWYSNAAHTTGAETFTFEVNLTVKAASFTVDGAVITTTVPFGFWNTATSTLAPYEISLGNISPTIVTWPSLPQTYDIQPTVANPQLALLAYNGSNIFGGYKFEGLSWSITAGNSEGYLYFDTTTTPNVAQLMTTDALPSPRTITVRVMDEGYLTNSVSFDIGTP
jgi:hypothetical protein